MTTPREEEGWKDAEAHPASVCVGGHDDRPETWREVRRSPALLPLGALPSAAHPFAPPLCGAAVSLSDPELRRLSPTARVHCIKRRQLLPGATPARSFLQFATTIGERLRLVGEAVSEAAAASINWQATASRVEEPRAMEILAAPPAPNQLSPLHPAQSRGTANELLLARLAAFAHIASVHAHPAVRRLALADWEALVLATPLVRSLVAWAFLRNMLRERASSQWWPVRKARLAALYAADVEYSLVPWPLMGGFPVGSAHCVLSAPFRAPWPRWDLTPGPAARAPEAGFAARMLALFPLPRNPPPRRGICWPALAVRVDNLALSRPELIAEMMSWRVASDGPPELGGAAGPEASLMAPGGSAASLRAPGGPSSGPPLRAALRACVGRVQEAERAGAAEAVASALHDWEGLVLESCDEARAMAAFCYVRALIRERAYPDRPRPPDTLRAAFEDDVLAAGLPWPTLNGHYHGSLMALMPGAGSRSGPASHGSGSRSGPASHGPEPVHTLGQALA
jgi:hypothetical protein